MGHKQVELKVDDDFYIRVSVLSEILHGVNFFDFVLAIGY